MDTAIVKILVGCIFVCWKLGLVQNLTYCQNKYENYGMKTYFVNVCQDNSRRMEHGTNGVIVIDTAGAPIRQYIECKCYFRINQRQQNMQVYLNIFGGDRQDVALEINGQVYHNGVQIITFTSGTEMIFRQGYQVNHANVCMVISKKAVLRGSLTIECKANRKERKRSTTTERRTTIKKTTPTTTTTTARPTTSTSKRPTTTTHRPTTTPTKGPKTTTILTTARPTTATTKRPTMTTQRTHSVFSSGPMSKKTAVPAMPEKTSTLRMSNKTVLPSTPKKTSIPSPPQMTSTITTQNEKIRSMGPPLSIVIGTATGAVTVLAVIVVGINALVWRRKSKTNRTTIDHYEVVPAAHNVTNPQIANVCSPSIVSSGYVNARLPRDLSSSTVSNTYASLKNHYNCEDDHTYQTIVIGDEYVNVHYTK